MPVIRQIPVFPLPDVVFFPGTVLPLVIPAREYRAPEVAAVVAAAAGLAAAGLPFKTGLLIAALAGILAGMAAERRRS